MATAPAIHCPKCLAAIPLAGGRATVEMSCPACRTALTVLPFPRLTAGTGDPGKADDNKFSGEGDAVCHFYPELQAETICGECGCFLSRKAAVDWGGRTLCLPCLHSLREGKKADEFLARRTIYDNVALGLTIFLAPLSFITGPLAFYYVVRYRDASRGLAPRSRFRWWLALVLSVALTCGWVFLVVLWIAMIVRAAST